MTLTGPVGAPLGTVAVIAVVAVVSTVAVLNFTVLQAERRTEPRAVDSNRRSNGTC